MNKKHFQTFLKAAISVLLMWYLFTYRISVDELMDSVVSVNLSMIALAVFTFALSCAAGALQWQTILRLAGIKTPAAEVFRLYFVGLFFNNFLPANVGGDAVKIFDLGKSTGDPVKVFCGTLLDRLIGLLALTLLALLAVVVAIVVEVDLPAIEPLLFALVVWAALLVVLLSKRVGALVRNILRSIKLGIIAEKLDQFTIEFRLYRTRLSELSGVLLLAGGVQFLRIMTHVFFALGIGLVLNGVQVLQLFVLVPMLGILIALPISIGGLGVREMAAGSLFVALGVVATTSDAVAMELGTWLVQVLVSLSGGVLFFIGMKKEK
ncbi:flippase-like domain-containing protein [bacterium]|nr:flippase-like domain-containing protein [bacterium]MBT4291672.1 flippase-like domain-containing protein [bacterium]MBT7310460.1 flippase-like domain-containing protein [bacterium]